MKVIPFDKLNLVAGGKFLATGPQSLRDLLVDAAAPPIYKLPIMPPVSLI